MATMTPTITLRKWRISQFEELGFTSEEAGLLETATRSVFIRDSRKIERHYEIPLDYHKVAKLLEAGATRDQILRIFT